ncbi:N-(5'-phosphoribosyl)anthranilate isomerase [Neptunitalea sp. Y10]|uniref:N-(5'-phosphoribosyl)anthranilate isomerase n=2 Tax=Neptunitalea lumnitzerae TaxID=2965509 RepID=A0ABQ5MNF2_9FLAO|nr:N-(5'-phosphoribosyl)anthranilate isomerase [Neptunitalea sp. Y10]
MRDNDNILELSKLNPDYMGFIFYDKSSRYVTQTTPTLPDSIMKTGVFVNSPVEFIIDRIDTHQLRAIQLHGNESVEFCKYLKTVLHNTQIIKVFSIKDDFDFTKLTAYEPYVDYFLFDTKGKLPGGNGYTFDWSVLKNYNATKPYFLSGGIGIESLLNLKDFFNLPASEKCIAIDVNSKFETAPGLKNIELLKKFKTELAAVNLI